MAFALKMLPCWSRLGSRCVIKQSCVGIPVRSLTSSCVVRIWSPQQHVLQLRGVGATTTPSESQPPQRYGPLDVDLQPKDQLRPLLPTWNPPPTRPPTADEFEVSTRLRFKFEDRWWAASVRSISEDGRLRIGFDGWPSRHDEWVSKDSDRIYLHESFHPEYVAPPIPKRYQRPQSTDADGNLLPATPRPPRPKVFDPEKERLKRALRPPLPFNPEKERLKRVLRGQYVPLQENHNLGASTNSPAETSAGSDDGKKAGMSHDAEDVRSVSNMAKSAPPPPGPPLDSVRWVEIPGGVDGTRAFRSTSDDEVRKGPPPSGWVELLADGDKRYYWHVEKNITQWNRP